MTYSRSLLDVSEPTGFDHLPIC